MSNGKMISETATRMNSPCDVMFEVCVGHCLYGQKKSRQ